jgi:putative addiction module component (TIGR02574 family)
MNDIRELLKLSVEERLELIGLLWDSIEAEQHPSLTEAQKAELDRRIAEHEADPSTALAWEDVRAELAREIEARRTGVYQLTPDEEAALDAALKSPVVPDDKVRAFWKARGIE